MTDAATTDKAIRAYERKRPAPCACEVAVLGAVLINPSCFETVYAVIGNRDDVFLEARAQAVYDTMRMLHLDGRPIDVCVLLDAMPDSFEDNTPSYLSELMGTVPTSVNAEAYAINVMTAYREREATRIALEMITGDRSEFSRHVSSLRALTAPATQRPPQAIHVISEALIAEYDSLETHPKRTAVPTGIWELDDILRGGLQRSELIIIAARPSKGKSALALNVAHHAAERQTATILFSLEMTARSLTERLWSIHDGVDVQQITRRELGSFQLNKAKAVTEESHRWTLWVDDAPTMNIAYIESQAKRFAERHSNPLIIIDYLQLIKVMGRGHNREREVAEMSAALKGLSRELDCPVVCLSQLNRETEQIPSRYSKLRGLRESGAVEQDADVVLILTPQDDTDECKNTWITVAKQRNGRTGEILTHFDKTRQTFHAISKDTPPTTAQDSKSKRII